MQNDGASFVWYELLTTDAAAARTFYGSVLGWDSRDVSTPAFSYNLFMSGGLPRSGLMELPEEGRRQGAMPRWVGYVGVADIDATVGRIRELGGAVYVPPTGTNIGRISIVADPQGATFGLVNDLKIDPPPLADLDASSRVGWHELLAANWRQAFDFYAAVFGWRPAEVEIPDPEPYQLFSAGGLTAGGIFNKRPHEAVPFWLYYFNVDDVDAATSRVTAGGGRVYEGPLMLPDSSWIVRCLDPQDATFALQGPRSQDSIAKAPVAEYRWTATWDQFSSKGRWRGERPPGKGRPPGK
ncbi:VOC family protein [Bradyrhizobium jicamae]|uniref:VOC family protein n=1 Tax=Bradyrhizobium jicamae TaxID=280332 RepID=A0ABS5FLF1_9BRAD|nr:VOC family protein [Bradyrhizobium jicamae]MBR0797609.1 VOC family protein [Bradyrhizobium jicamae]MBR0937272.1 VOC family protein [Bradyrhizobium jicamae]